MKRLFAVVLTMLAVGSIAAVGLSPSAKPLQASSTLAADIQALGETIEDELHRLTKLVELQQNCREGLNEGEQCAVKVDCAAYTKSFQVIQEHLISMRARLDAEKVNSPEKESQELGYVTVSSLTVLIGDEILKEECKE